MSKVKLFIISLLVAMGVFAAAILYLPSPVTADTQQSTRIALSGPPALSAWLLNRSGSTGYNGLSASVQQIRYSTNYAYINSSSIPYYSIGPWTQNPNIPTNQGFLFKIPRNPTVQAGNKTATGLGAIGFWIDGVAIFNALDGFSYNNQNIWHQDAVVNEAISFDTCNGHPAPMGTYHHHLNPKCVWNITPNSHSPLIGFAYDGFPIYGAYGYTNTNGTGAIKRIASSYRLRSITDRTTLPNGTVLAPAQYGPTLAAKALGTYVEDYEYVTSLGDLDQYNGRTAVTPEYPGGTYAYYVTIYTDGTSAYPYYIGPSYNGVVPTENITTRGHVTITEPVTNYVPSAVTSDLDGDGKTDVSIFRPTAANGSEWWWLKSSNGTNSAVQFGTSTDKIVPGDFTGDGKTDVAFWRPGTGQWFVLRSEDFSFYAFPFGTTGDVPVPADYDGDGKADAAVFRESSVTWFISKSSGGTDILTFGAAGDKPVNSDYDGDGKSDVAIFRPNGASGAEWWIRRSSNASVVALQFGASTDKAVAGDYTGDGKADVAFWRPSTGFWNVLRSEDFSYYAFPFGTTGDVASPGDYDGDGKLDAAVFRPSSSTWFANRSTAGVLIQQFGTTGDLPVPNAFVR